MGMLFMSDFLDSIKICCIRREIVTEDLKWAYTMKSTGITDPDKFLFRMP
jgi:hypothetical protein